MQSRGWLRHTTNLVNTAVIPSYLTAPHSSLSAKNPMCNQITSDLKTHIHTAQKMGSNIKTFIVPVSLYLCISRSAFTVVSSSFSLEFYWLEKNLFKRWELFERSPDDKRRYILGAISLHSRTLLVTTHGSLTSLWYYNPWCCNSFYGTLNLCFRNILPGRTLNLNTNRKTQNTIECFVFLEHFPGKIYHQVSLQRNTFGVY